MGFSCNWLNNNPSVSDYLFLIIFILELGVGSMNNQGKHSKILLVLLIAVVMTVLVVATANLLTTDGVGPSHLVCYKTECNFWGCHQLKVDLNSSVCELRVEEYDDYRTKLEVKLWRDD